MFQIFYRIPVVFVGMVVLSGLPSVTAQESAGELKSSAKSISFKSKSGKSVTAERGEFSVPENRRRPDSRKIRLTYIRFPCTGDQPGSPIVYLAGGPGGSGTAAARGARFEMLMSLRRLGDVIAFDQRGTGMSNALPNGASWRIPVDAVATRQVYREAVEKALDESIEIWEAAGVDLLAYNTEENAADLVALRKVLKADQLRLISISYGTHLAMSFIRNYPDQVERAVLAGVEGPDDTLKWPRDQQALLEKIQVWIDADPESSQKYPELLAALGRVLEKLDREPVILETGRRKVVVTSFDVRYLLANMLRGPESFAMLPRLVKKMDAGDFNAVRLFVWQVRKGSFRPMSLATDVASGVSPGRRELVAAQAESTLLGDAINFPMNVAMDRMGHLELADPFRNPVLSDVPVLAISGTADGRTPPSNATEVLKTLNNGHHLIIHGAGHSDPLFLSSPQILETMTDFFEGSEADLSEIRLPPIRFAK